MNQRIKRLLKFKFAKGIVSKILTNSCFGLLVILLLVLTWILFFDDLHFLFQMFGTNNKTKLIEIVGIAIAGNVLLIQATVSYRRAVAMERTVTLQVQQGSVIERGNRQSLFKSAIDHLGSTSSMVRLSAGHELFELALNFEDLRATVFSILCAHIRETTTKLKYRDVFKNHPSEEVQSLISVLFVDGKEIFHKLPADLSRCWLRGATFRNAALIRGRFDDANLEHAKLWHGDFRDSSFMNAKLAHLRCYDTMFQYANFFLADLSRAKLQGMLQGATLDCTTLDGADLSRSQMQGAKLRFASLKGALLNSTRLYLSDLTYANLQGSFVGNTQFQAATLINCDMRGVSCDEPPVGQTFEERMKHLCGRPSDLSNVQFKGNLTQTNIDEALKHLTKHDKDNVIKMLSSHLGTVKEVNTSIGLGIKTGAYTERDLRASLNSKPPTYID